MAGDQHARAAVPGAPVTRAQRAMGHGPVEPCGPRAQKLAGGGPFSKLLVGPGTGAPTRVDDATLPGTGSRMLATSQL